MSSSQYFRWTDQAKNDLRSLISAVDQSSSINWSNIEENFKKKYPSFKGTKDALRKQYERSKKEKHVFQWCDEAYNDLCNIANKSYENKSGKINCTHVLNEFCKTHPNFGGKKDSLKKQYRRNKTPNLTQLNIESPQKTTQKFHSPDQANSDLMEENKNVDLCDTDNNPRNLHIPQRQALVCMNFTDHVLNAMLNLDLLFL